MADVVIEIPLVAPIRSIPNALTIAIEKAFTNEIPSLEVPEPLGIGGLYQVLDLIFRVVVFGDQSEDQYDATWMSQRGDRVGDHR